jgi:hypothetical protein
MAREIYRSAFTKNDLFKASTVSCNAGEYTRVGEYKVVAGELVSVGAGDQSGQESAQGRIFIDIKDNGTSPGANVDGVVRLTVYSPQDRPIEILGEWRTETLRTVVTDRTKQIPFPEDDLFVSEDKKLVLEFKSDTSATLGKVNSTVLIDITKATV